MLGVQQKKQEVCCEKAVKSVQLKLTNYKPVELIELAVVLNANNNYGKFIMKKRRNLLNFLASNYVYVFVWVCLHKSNKEAHAKQKFMIHL